jgi:hypothetical protein
MAAQMDIIWATLRDVVIDKQQNPISFIGGVINKQCLQPRTFGFPAGEVHLACLTDGHNDLFFCTLIFFSHYCQYFYILK